MSKSPPTKRAAKPHSEHLCPKFQQAMSVLSRPWNGLIIFALEPGPLRFAELAERISTIGDRMLSARLKELVLAGVVARQVDPGPPVRVSYGLTEAGRGFRAVSDAVTAWGVTLSRAKERPRTRG